MKKLTLLLVSFFFGLSMQAGVVTEAQALQKAQKLMKGKQLTQVQDRSMARGASATAPAYYVFNAEKNGGFVVIAGNDQMPEVLGYAERGSFDLSQAPDNVKWLFDYYAEVARSLEKQPADRRAATRGDSKANLIPLLTTQWDQSGIYQQHCPEVNASKFSFNDKGGSGTGISDTTFQPESGAANGAWYSLDGRRVEAQPAKPGLYIHNGRKLITK